MRSFNTLFRRVRTYLRCLYRNAFSDQRIATYLAKLFESDLHALEAEGLRFFVKNRIVTIYGTVYREVDRELVIRHASRIIGLKAVVDRMQLIDSVYEEDLSARIVLVLNDIPESTRLLPA